MSNSYTFRDLIHGDDSDQYRLEGFFAHKAGLKQSDNPYKAGTKIEDLDLENACHYDWEVGYDYYTEVEHYWDNDDF